MVGFSQWGLSEKGYRRGSDFFCTSVGGSVSEWRCVGFFEPASGGASPDIPAPTSPPRLAGTPAGTCLENKQDFFLACMSSQPAVSHGQAVAEEVL